MQRFSEYDREAKPKIKLVLWHENIQMFETEVLRQLRSVFQERKDIGTEYFQGDLEQMKQLIVSHYIPSIITNDVKDMLRMLVEKHNATEKNLQIYIDKQNVLESKINYFKDFRHYCKDKLKLFTDRLDDVEEGFEDVKAKLEDIDDSTVTYGELEEMNYEMYNKVTRYIDKMQICHFQEHVEEKISLYQEFVNALCKRYTDTIITHKMHDYITFVIKELHEFFNYIHGKCSRGTIVCCSPSYAHDGINYDEDEWSVSVEEVSDILERLSKLKELWRMKVDVARTTFHEFVKINDMMLNIGCFVNRSWQIHCNTKLDISEFFSFKCVPLEDVPTCIDKIIEVIQNMTYPYHGPLLLEDSHHVTSDNIVTPENLVQEAIKFHKQHNLSNTDLVETVQEMLSTSQYILSEDFTKTKLDLDEANTLFLSAISPKAIKKDGLQRLLFKSKVYDDL